MLESLRKLFSSYDKTNAPEGICPNCWGKQEYGGEFYEAVKNNNVDISNFEETKGWILDYAERNLNHIKLINDKNSNGTICQTCKITFKK